MTNKKGTDNIWWIIMGAVVAIVAVIFLIIWFRSSGEKGYGAISKEIGELDDCDGDKVSDFLDRCDCTPAPGSADGCPEESAQKEADKNKKKPECCVKP